MNFKKFASAAMAAAMLVSAVPAVNAFAWTGMEFEDAFVLELGTEDSREIPKENRYLYTFSLEKSGLVKLDFTEQTKAENMSFVLYNGDRERLNTWSASNHVAKTDIYLNAGTYYIQLGNVNLGGDGSTYTLKADFEAVDETYPETAGGNNNSTDTANELLTDTVYKGMLALNDGKDIYKLTLDSAKTLFWTIDSNIPDIDFIIYNTVGEELFSKDYHVNDKIGKMLVQAEYDFDAGEYFIVIDRRWAGNTGTYSLDLKTTRELGGSLSDPQPILPNGDVNSDGKVDASDASIILAYYAYNQTGGKDDFATWMSNRK